jgi:hypothetical protein
MKGVPRTGIPDGAGEMTKPSKIRGVDRESNKGGSVGDEPNKIDMTPMPETARKGAFGKPITPSGATTTESNTEFRPEASDAGAVEKYGLARGKFGANTGQS